MTEVGERMERVALEQRRHAARFVRDRDLQRRLVPPDRPTFDAAVQSRDLCGDRLAVRLKDLDGVAQDTGIRVAANERLGGVRALSALRPDEHSTIGGDVVRRQFERPGDVAERADAVAHLMRGLGAQHVTMGLRRRGDAAAAVREHEGCRAVALGERARGQKLQRLMMGFVDDRALARHPLALRRRLEASGDRCRFGIHCGPRPDAASGGDPSCFR